MTGLIPKDTKISLMFRFVCFVLKTFQQNDSSVETRKKINGTTGTGDCQSRWKKVKKLKRQQGRERDFVYFVQNIHLNSFSLTI